GDPQRALAIVEPTIQTFKELADQAHLGLAYGNYAAALEGCKRYEEALKAYAQAADLLKQSGNEEQRIKTLQALSALQLKTGKQLQAVATMQAALEDLPKPTLKQKLLMWLLKTPFNFLAK
ncbi:MAG: tetratricopeptide repeat protein, partial [Anaerolineales bacterium]